MLKQIPNFFTLLNLLCGCLAIIFILQPGEITVMPIGETGWTQQLPEKIWLGGMLIGLAALIDFLDGFFARLLKASSSMGAQLDSLSDVVSFGVAPGMILWQLLKSGYAAQENGLDVSLWQLSPALLFPAAVAWRLARFNTDTGSDSSFSGMPSPAAGLLIASLPLILFYDQSGIITVLSEPWLIYLIILLVAFLMVSRIPFLALKSGTNPASRKAGMVMGVTGIVAVATLQWLAIPLLILLYILLSLFIKQNNNELYRSGKGDALERTAGPAGKSRDDRT